MGKLLLFPGIMINLSKHPLFLIRERSTRLQFEIVRPIEDQSNRGSSGECQRNGLEYGIRNRLINQKNQYNDQS